MNFAVLLKSIIYSQSIKSIRSVHKSKTIPEVQQLIDKLKLRPHPLENGYFSDNTYESTKQMKIDNHDLALSDCVYWLYEEGDFAPWHRMIPGSSDEFWIHQSGGSLEVHIIESENPRYVKKILEPCGTVLIPHGTWFAAHTAVCARYTLFSAMLCPGFHDANCEFAPKSILDDVKLSQEEKSRLTKYFK